VLAYAYDRGFRYFDTAPLYANGLGEHWFGTALRQRDRDDFVLSTKVGRRLRPQCATPAPADRLAFEYFYDYSYDGVLRSFEDSLQRLGLCGVVRAIGVGVKGADVCLRFARAGDFDLFMLAGGYTLLEHAALDDFLPYCIRHDIGVVVASPFNSGILASGAVPGATFFYTEASPEIIERTRRLEAVCARHGVPLGAAALQFTLAHPAVVSAVCGYRSTGEVDTNMRWATQPIPAALWDELKSAALVPAHAPVAASLARSDSGAP
jgi:D-threo-aldose 1-dehydrogenase